MLVAALAAFAVGGCAHQPEEKVAVGIGTAAYARQQAKPYAVLYKPYAQMAALAYSDAGNVHVTVPYGPYHVDANTDAGSVKVEGVIRDDLAPQAIDAVTDAGDILVRAR